MSDPKKPLRADDLDKWDRQSIREASIKLFLEKKDLTTPECVMEATINYLYSKGYDIVRNEERQDTASRPSKGWYTPQEKKKNYYE